MENEETQHAIEELAASVAEQLNSGVPKQEVVRGLSDAGLDPLEAERLVNDIERLRYQYKDEERKEGTKDLGCGFLLLLVGAGITFGTWAAAGPGGSHWVMWGAMAFGAFYILRGLVKKIGSATNFGIRVGWVLGSLILFGGIVGGGIAIGNMMNPPELTPPNDSFVVWDDNSFWEDEIQGIFRLSGTVTNSHSERSIKNVKIELEAMDEADKVIKTYDVSVTPSTIPPKGKGVYSKRLQVPYYCVSVTPIVVWEWVPP